MFANGGGGGGVQQQQSRTVYIGNIPSGTTYEDILNMVKFGPLESVKMVPDKKCCFLAFIEAFSAVQFFNEFVGKRVLIGDQELKFGWGKPSVCSPVVYQDVLNGTCRNVYIGQIDETITEESLRKEFADFGPIDQIRIIAEKRIAFVHLTSITQAVKAVAALPHRPLLSGKKVNFGKDRCGNTMVGLMSAAAAGAGAAAGTMMNGMGMMNGVAGMMPQQHFQQQQQQVGGFMTPLLRSTEGVPMNPQRTLYLGGLHPDATAKDICDVLRGGLVQKVHFLAEKNTAFVTFIDPMVAHALFLRGSNEGVVIKGKRVKIGWGKPAPFMPSNIFNALQKGATRNVYVGPLDATMTEQRLRTDFGEFGEVELINMVPEKQIGFVSFTDIASAIKVVEGLAAANPLYANLRVSYGKDRCNNPLRPARIHYQQQQHQQQQQQQHEEIEYDVDVAPPGEQ
ncbi:hypothetical protein BDR26DRAFT_799495 [Obelidium mucronatum]|nr:hypothetical protein BDR26DRAFT_799495 [Obelidium mucronatum]